MTVVLAGATGALLVSGVLLTINGLRRTQPAAPRPKRARRRVGWASGRGLLAGGAGLVVWAVSRWPAAGLIVAAAIVGLPYLLGSAKVAAGFLHGRT